MAGDLGGARGRDVIDALVRDARVGARLLRRTPVVTSAAIVSLSLAKDDRIAEPALREG